MKVRLIKKLDNKYDKDVIRVELRGLDKIGYVANSPHTVIGESCSVGRMYDLMKKEAKGKFLSHDSLRRSLRVEGRLRRYGEIFVLGKKCLREIIDSAEVFA